MDQSPGPASRLSAALADRYRIEHELGAGGMATVYLAQDLKHDRQVAIKVLKPELAAVLGADRFVQEIKTTAALQHPHILPLFDSGSADGFLYYVMPYIEGETLRAKLDREKQLGVDEAVKITTEVADALDYAHRHGVIHRDIKPENILLHDGRPMVADFGIALAVSAAAGGRMTETGLSLGTPHYMSPEQATAEKDITARSDVYSLASVLYEMLTGNPPHTGSSAQQIIMKIVTDTARPVTEFRAPGATLLGIRDASELPILSEDGSRLVFVDQGSSGGPNHAVMMRGTDGSPAARLGEGEPQAVSPDGRFVLADVPADPARLMLYATGPGTSRQLDVGPLASITAASGSLVGIGDDLRFTFCGARPEEGMRCYVGATAGGPVTPLTPQGTVGPARLSPDGKRVVVRVEGAMRIYPAAGGQSQPARGFTSDDWPIRWSPDGHDVWVALVDDSLTMHVDRVNPETGARGEVARIVPRAQPGLTRVGWLSLANDPHVYAYVEFTYLSTLYLVDGAP
jgi:serine/threonine protein kinase